MWILMVLAVRMEPFPYSNRTPNHNSLEYYIHAVLILKIQSQALLNDAMVELSEC
jgi:hypothetical protein